jgi:hypothetical protein|tara:strand:+ start:1951 stop:2376 length:426 start_codon:yes stop_codon:yes gene_type:complete
MRYYINNLYTPDTQKLNEYLKKQKKENIILATDGLYKYVDGDLFKFKLNSTEDDIVIDGDIIGTDVSWKKYDRSFQIPFIFKKIEIDISDFNIEKDVTLRIEKINNKISDYYFLSNYAYDNFFLKDGIISFLSLFNNINNI